jgi:hypothetical protein
VHAPQTPQLSLGLTDSPKTRRLCGAASETCLEDSCVKLRCS